MSVSHHPLPEGNTPEPLFTVFTPTYNRRDLLPRVFESLKKQTFKDFEWVVVDDGSTDGTDSLVRGWVDEAPFSLRYIPKQNGGKHTAINLGVKEARGALFTVIDSDDWLEPTGLEMLKREWDALEHKERFTGVCGLFHYPTGKVVGTPFPQDRIVSNAIDLRFKLGAAGDKIGFNRTEILRRFPFPEEFGRKYVPESIVWNRIAQEYDTLFVNLPIGIKEYQPSGITSNSSLNSYNNPGAYLVRALELMDGRREIGFGETLRCCATVAKSAIYLGEFPLKSNSIARNLLIILMLPMAIGLVLRDRRRLKLRQRG